MRILLTTLLLLSLTAAQAQVSTGTGNGKIISVTKTGATIHLTVPPEGRDLIVADFAHRFDSTDLVQLDTMLQRYENTYNIQLQVITVSQALLQPNPTHDYTEALWTSYTFGRPNAGRWFMIILYPDGNQAELRTSMQIRELVPEQKWNSVVLPSLNNAITQKQYVSAVRDVLASLRKWLQH